MFAKDRTVAGIDVGTHAVKVVVARLEERTLPQIIGAGSAETRGMREGYAANGAAVARSVRAALAEAEQMAGLPVRRAYLAIGGIGLDELRSRGEVITSRADSEISPIDIEKALADSEERVAERVLNRRILHTVPLSYAVDGEKVLGRPHGMKGTKLEVETLFATCLEQHLTDLIGAMEQAGVVVDDVIASPFAASFVTLTKAQRRAGCALVNIGAETLSIAVFENHLPVSLKVFPVGSSHITNDIALGLKISLEEAEKIKRGGSGAAQYSKRKLDEIISARLSDMFQTIDAHLRKIKRDGLLPAGVICIGGGSHIVGIEELARAALRLPSRRALFEHALGGKARDAVWAVAYGLCLWGGHSGAEEDSGIRTARRAGNSLLQWVKQFLP